MKILEIKNIKNRTCFKADNLSISLKEDFNLFVGENGSGKSSLLKYISNFLHQCYFKYPLDLKKKDNIDYEKLYIEGVFKVKITEQDVQNIENIKKHKSYYLEKAKESYFFGKINDFFDENFKGIKDGAKITIDQEGHKYLKYTFPFQFFYENKPKDLNLFLPYINFVEDFKLKNADTVSSNQVTKSNLMDLNINRGYPLHPFNSILRQINAEKILDKLSKIIGTLLSDDNRNLILNQIKQINKSFKKNDFKLFLSENKNGSENWEQVAINFFPSVLCKLNKELEKFGYRLSFFIQSKVCEQKKLLLGERKIPLVDTGLTKDLDCGKYIVKNEYGVSKKLQFEVIEETNYSFVIKIEKNGNTHFRFDDLGSGERKLVLFFIYLLTYDFDGGIFLIDEPERALHPQFQKILFEQMKLVAKQKNVQFIFSSHSPAIITHELIKKLFYFKNNGFEKGSSISYLSDRIDVGKKIQIIKSYQNEKIFFSDTVILVEGITDRVVFELLIKHLNVENKSIEILDVGGKGFFKHYEPLLKKLEINYFVIADLDNIIEYNKTDFKLISKSPKEISEKLKEKDSKDGKSFYQEIEKCLKENKITDNLKSLMDHIKKRHFNKDALVEKVKSSKKFGENEPCFYKKEQMFFLKKGELEDYLSIEQLKGDEGSKADEIKCFNYFNNSENCKKFLTKNNEIKRMLEIILTK